MAGGRKIVDSVAGGGGKGQRVKGILECLSLSAALFDDGIKGDIPILILPGIKVFPIDEAPAAD